MSNPLDDVSGGALLRFTAPGGIDKDDAGNTAREVDEGEYTVYQGQPPNGGGVVLTRVAAQLRAAGKTARESPAVDTGRIEKIRRQVAAESFRIDTRRAAAKLVAADEWFD